MMVTVAGKPEFVTAWKRARNEALTQKKVLKGWESTGIFPRDRSKALNSRFTVQADAVTPGEPDRSKTPDQSSALHENDHETPKNSRQVRDLVLRTLAVDSVHVSPSQRRSIWTLQKAFDALTAKNAASEQEIKQLKEALQRQRPQKQRRVLPRAQQAFMDIEDVSQAKDQLRDEVERGRPRRSRRYRQNRRSETPEIEDNWDHEIEEVLDEIQVIS